MANTVTSTALATAALDTGFTRADVEFSGLDHSGPSYEGRVYLNMPDANEDTGFDVQQFAGSYYIFGHGGCFGDEGHCEVRSRRFYDPRPDHPLTATRKVVIATDAVRHAKQAEDEITVTVVPVILATTGKAGEPDDVVHYERVRIVTYR
jgi:hypothetical protein